MALIKKLFIKGKTLLNKAIKAKYVEFVLGKRLTYLRGLSN